MPRKNLSDLLSTVEVPITAAAASAETAVTAAEPPVRTASPTAPPRSLSTAPAVRAKPVETEGPPYLALVRKETRLREDQQNLLTLHARRLNRVKPRGAPRITDNSLIRIAIDLLLARIEEAAGGDEASILKSLNR